MIARLVWSWWNDVDGDNTVDSYCEGLLIAILWPFVFVVIPYLALGWLREMNLDRLRRKRLKRAKEAEAKALREAHPEAFEGQGDMAQRRASPLDWFRHRSK